MSCVANMQRGRRIALTASVIAKKLQYLRTHPPTSPSSVLKSAPAPASSSPIPIPIPPFLQSQLGWLSSIVSRQEAALVFRRTFSRPFRLLFTNPVCAMFCLYYSYIYALIYLFLVAIPLLYGQAPFGREGLFSYGWELHVLPASYIGLGRSHRSYLL